MVATGQYRWWNNDGTLRFKKNSNASITISVPSGYVVTGITITGGKAWSTEDGNYSSSTGKWAGSVQSVKLTVNTDAANNVNTVTVTYTAVVPITVTDASYATFCSANALDFSGVTGVTAYTASVSGDEVTFSPVEGTVPAETGLLLKADAGTYNVPVVASSETDVTGNILVGVTEANKTLTNDDDTKNYYVLRNAANGLGFYRITAPTYNFKVGTAYLLIEGTPLAKGFIGLDGDLSGLNEELRMNNDETSAPAYNLAGQRVGEGYKGVVIVNGKKVIR